MAEILAARIRSPIQLGFLVRRGLGALVALWGAVTIVFIMLYSTGNPAEVLAPETATIEQVRELAARYGFDQPLLVQYRNFIVNVSMGVFPDSLYTARPAFQEVVMRIPNTLILSLTAVFVGSAVGLMVGYLAAMSENPLVRTAPIRALMFLQSVPNFFLGLLLMYLFSLTLRWLPTSGLSSWRSLVLPVITLACYVAPNVARLFRSTINEMRFEEHILTARAKGISDRSVRIRHNAINALGPVATLIGLQLGGVLAGAVVVETLFAYPGVGQLLVQSVVARDYPVALAAVMLICLGYTLASVLVDIVVVIIDPRAQKR
jgi:ABC-type dipeptide/oligopeptide/nickel transport system permease component